MVIGGANQHYDYYNAMTTSPVQIDLLTPTKSDRFLK